MQVDFVCKKTDLCVLVVYFLISSASYTRSLEIERQAARNPQNQFYNKRFSNTMTPDAARLTRLNFYIPQEIENKNSYWVPNSWTSKTSVPKVSQTIKVNGINYNKYQVIKIIIQPGGEHPFINEEEITIKQTLQSIFDNKELKVLDVEVFREEKIGDRWFKPNGHKILKHHKVIIQIAFSDDYGAISVAAGCLKAASKENGWDGVYVHSQTNEDIYFECDIRNAIVHILTQLDSEYLKNADGEKTIFLLLHIDAVGKPDITFISLKGLDIEGENIFKNNSTTSVCFPFASAAAKDTTCSVYVRSVYKQIIEGIHNAVYKLGNCNAKFKFGNVLFEVADRACLKLFTGMVHLELKILVWVEVLIFCKIFTKNLRLCGSMWSWFGFFC